MAAKVLGLSFFLSAGTEDLAKNLSKGKRQMQRFGDSGAKQGKRIDKAMRAAAIGAGLLAAGIGAIGAATLKSVDNLDQLAKAAGRADIPPNVLRQWRLFGELGGAAVGSIDTALRRLRRRIGEALDIQAQGRGDVGYVRVFRELGVAFADTEGKARRTEDVLNDLNKSLANAEDPTKAFGLALRLLDSEGAALATAMIQSGNSIDDLRSKMESTGNTIDESVIRQAEAAKDVLTELEYSWEANSTAITGLFIPAIIGLNKLLPTLTSGFIKIRERLDDAFDRRDNEALKDQFEELANAALAAEADLANLEASPTKLFFKGLFTEEQQAQYLYDLKEKAKALRKKAQAVLRQIDDEEAAEADARATTFSPIGTPDFGDTDDAENEIEELNKELYEFVDALKEAGDSYDDFVEKTRRKADQDSFLRDLSQPTFEEISDIAGRGGSRSSRDAADEAIGSAIDFPADQAKAEFAELGKDLVTDFASSVQRAIETGNWDNLGDAFLSSLTGTLTKKLINQGLDLLFDAIGAGAASSFHEGGVVPRIGGRKEVPALLLPGETVRTVDQERDLQKGMGGTINFTVNVPPGRTDIRKYLEEDMDFIVDNVSGAMNNRGLL